MAKALADDIALVPETLDWSRSVPVARLEAFVAAASTCPLVAVGSGGSLTAAHFAALLHRRRHLTFARAATPLELFVSEPGLGKGAALLLSASGKNRDILAALAACTTSGTAALATLCTRRNSPLAAAAKSYARSHVFEEDLPAGEEGLLATNSLLATAVLLARAYGYTIPDRFQDSPPDPGARAAFEGRRLCVVLHGGFGSPAAVDFETKLNEAALVPAQSCDYRNFGHGRQLWLSRCPGEVVVIAVVSPDVAELAARTLALIPEGVRVVRMRSELEGAAGAVDLLVQSLRLFGVIAEAQGFDGSLAKVPEFCFRIYNLAP